jgi:hypothetical protein
MSKLLLSEFPDFHRDFKRQYDDIYARYDNRPHFNLMPYISTLDFYIKNLLIADNIRYSQIFIDLRDKKRQLPYSILRFMKNAAYDYTKFDFNSTQKLNSPKLHEKIGNQSGDYCFSEVNRLYDNTLLADDIAYSLDKSTPGQQLNWIKNFLEVRQNQFKVFFSFGECDSDETRMPVYP